MAPDNMNGHLLCWHCGLFDTVTLRDPIREVLDRHFPDVDSSGPFACLACGMTGVREDFLFQMQVPTHSLLSQLQTDLRPWCCWVCETVNSVEDGSCQHCRAPRFGRN